MTSTTCVIGAHRLQFCLDGRFCFCFGRWLDCMAMRSLRVWTAGFHGIAHLGCLATASTGVCRLYRSVYLKYFANALTGSCPLYLNQSERVLFKPFQPFSKWAYSLLLRPILGKELWVAAKHISV